ncbi:hypothetical protein, partial [Staphylococcus aureus]|uniref:hypothetical protein n=1 Tax=Staphylococcus aureus TaxID=1280 RepID=UPI003D135A34
MGPRYDPEFEEVDLEDAKAMEEASTLTPDKFRHQRYLLGIQLSNPEGFARIEEHFQRMDVNLYVRSRFFLLIFEIAHDFI